MAELIQKSGSSSNVVFLTVEETHDSKNSSKIAHKSCSPKYNNEGTLMGYNFSNITESAQKKKDAEKKSKK